MLDTHVLLWWLAGAERLTSGVRAQIADPTAEVLVSVASACEVEIKRARGKMEAPADLQAALDRSGFSALDITLDHAIAAGRLPRHHDDPFDRMIVSQAIVEGLTLVTADPVLGRYSVDVLAAI